METDTKIAEAMVPIERASKIKTELALTTAGVVLPANMAEVTALAQYMAKCDKAIPAFMRNNPGECMSVIMDGINWEMNPFALARMRYVVNDIGAYLAQVLAAVVQRRAPIRERVIAPTYTGDGTTLQCSFKLHHRDTDELIEYESPKLGEIKVQNSPLWKTEPRQQLYYYSVRAMARRHFPAVLLGAYDVEEARAMRDITPKETKNLLEDPEDAPAATVQGEVIPPERKADEYREAVDRPYTEQEVNDAYVRAQKRGKTVEPQVPLGDEDNLYEGEAVGDRPAADSEQAELLPPETSAQAELSTDRIYMNIVRGLKECRTSKDYGAWRSDNYTPEVRKKIGEERWKNLGEIMMDIETKVGWL